MSEKEIYLLTKRVIALESTRATKEELDVKLNAAVVASEKQLSDLNNRIDLQEEWLGLLDDGVKKNRAKSLKPSEKKSIWARVISSITIPPAGR